MNQEICRDCKHWTGDASGRGTCSRFHAMPIGRTAVMTETGTYPPEVTLPLRTYSEFGCVRWEEKPD